MSAISMKSSAVMFAQPTLDHDRLLLSVVSKMTLLQMKKNKSHGTDYTAIASTA